MAHFRRWAESFSPTRTLTINGSELVDDHTVYNIQLCVGLFKWCVRHRYNDFYALHEKLMRQFPGLDWSLLPKKKLFGSQSEGFILKRQAELEVYLQSLLRSLPTIPSDLMKFLDFHKYEVHGITELLTETLYELGDSILESDKLYHVNPLQLYAICTRLALPEPTCDSKDMRKDIGHLLDFLTRLKCLQINGSSLPVGRSNINMNDLSFDLHCFKSLSSLHIKGCNIEKISEVEHLKKTLSEISVSHCLSALKEILLIGIGRGQLTMCDANTATLLVQPWVSVQRATFNHNRISQIDESIKLLRNVEFLDLSHNRLDTIDNLQHLSSLRKVILAHNMIRQVPALHTKLGNITYLDISNNKLETLEGLAKLYSLETLIVNHNDIMQILEVKFVGGLPCLEVLDLRDNPVASVLDYRTMVFEFFGDRALEISLDGTKPTEQEIELVAVRSALNKSREQKRTVQRTPRRSHVNEPTIADADLPELSDSPAASTSRSFSNSNPDPCTPAEPPPREALPVGRPSVVLPGESATASDAASLRQKIAHLKEKGGSCWLRQLNDLLQSENHAQLDQAAKTPHDLPTEPPPQQNVVNRGSESASFPLGHLKRIQRKIHEPESLSKTNGESGKKTKKPINIMLPETLPSATDGAVCSYLQSLLPSRGSKGTDSEQYQELPIHIMWCTTVLQRAKQDVEFPGCVYITTDNLHVFSVRSLAGDTGIPELSRTLRLPLEKVTQITIGYESLCVQLEWSSAEPHAHGLIVFLTFSHGKTNAFINAIKLAHRRSIPELDDYEDPHIVPGSGLEASLKNALNAFERRSDPEEVQILLYSLVMVEGSSAETVRTSSLVTTSRYIYVINQDYCNTPLPSFSKAPPLNPVFDVVSIFPVSSRLVNIQMYDIDTIESSSYHSLWSTFGKTGVGNGLSVGFIGYGVRMSFHLGEYGIQVLDVRMPTSNQREKFLNVLVKVHANISDVLTKSSFQKFKTPSPRRDADSLSCASSGSQRSSGRPKEKQNKKRTIEVTNDPIESVQKDGAKTPYDKNQVLRDAAPESRTSNNLDRNEVSSDSPITEIYSTRIVDPANENFECKESDLPLSATKLSSELTLQPCLTTDDTVTRSNDVAPLMSGVNDGDLVEKDLTKYDLPSDERSNIYDEDRRREPVLEDMVDASGLLQDVVESEESHVDLIIRSSSSESSLSEEFSHEDTSRREQSDESPLTTEETLKETQFVSDNDIAVIRLAVGSTNQRTRAINNNTSKIHAVRPDNKRKEKGVHENLEPTFLPLQCGYPSNDLLLHLTESFGAVPLFPQVSAQFEAFMSLNGLELVNYFHQNIAVISTENEELAHVMWSLVVPYKDTLLEIPSCVLLSTKAIYFVSDRYERNLTPASLSRSHKRCFSDTSSLQPCLKGDLNDALSRRLPCHLSCGILNNSSNSEKKHVFRVYGVIPLKDLKQVNIGIFSQSIRLTGSSEETIFSCVTRDCQTSEAFLHRLKDILTRCYPLPLPDDNLQDLEQDFYSMFSKSRPSESRFTDDGRFVYPLDDSIADTTFLIKRALKGDNASTSGIRLLSCLLCFQIDSSVSSKFPYDLLCGKPRTLILTEGHLVLAVEDHVSYPLPDFARMPPARPQMEIVEVRRLEFLQKIVLQAEDVHLLVLVFSDDTGEVVVDTSVEHFGSDGGKARDALQNVPEIRWTLLVQNAKSKDKLIRLISQQWDDVHVGRRLTISTLP